MKTYLDKIKETKNLSDDFYFEMKPIALKRALVDLRKILKFMDEDAWCAWADDLVTEGEEKYAMNGASEIEIESRFTKSGRIEFVTFSGEDFLLTNGEN